MSAQEEGEREEANSPVYQGKQSAGSPINTLVDADAEHIWVHFEEGDPENPFNWTRRRKWITTFLASWTTALVAGYGSGFAIGLADMEKDLGNSHEISLLAVTLYPLGFGIIPLMTAPLSETFGRQNLYIGTFVIYTIIMIPLALAPNIACVLICRFLSGAAGSTGSTVVGGTIADIWTTSERGVPMAIFSAAAFLGTAGSFTVMGYLVQYTSWRWIAWLTLICSGATVAGILLFLRETRGSVILSRRAHKLRKETGDTRYQCRADLERKSLVTLVRLSLTRPLWYLVSEPVVISMTVYIVFAWAILWGLMESVPLIFEEVYHFNLGQTGLSFFSLVIGACIALALNFHQEHLYKKYFPKYGPEARLYYSCAGGITFVIGSIIVAVAQGRTHWIVVCIGYVLIQFAIFHIYISVFNYLADAYTIYASSALAAQSFARNCIGGCFPLFIPQMYHNLTFTWAGVLLAGLGAVLTTIPFILLWKGAKIRESSKQVQEIMRIHEEISRQHNTPPARSTEEVAPPKEVA